MHVDRLGRIVGGTGGWTTAFAAVFAAVLMAAPSARAHGGVSIGIGFGFPAFIGAPVYAPPVYYVPPRFATTRPTSVITDHRRHTGVTTIGYTIIVIAAVATDHTINAVACVISCPHRVRQRI